MVRSAGQFDSRAKGNGPRCEILRRLYGAGSGPTPFALEACAMSKSDSKSPTPLPADRLIAWAKAKFGKLTSAENTLLTCVPNGEMADVSSGSPAGDEPANADDWGKDRDVRAELIRWLCVDRKATELVDAKGIQLKGARINGPFDLEDRNVPFALACVRCVFTDEINVRDAHINALNLDGTRTKSIDADGLVAHVVRLSAGFEAHGEVRLLCASIGRDLCCDFAKFSNKGGVALNAERCIVTGSVFLRNGFRARGEVRLLNASIGGDLDCKNAEFLNKGGVALIGDCATVKGNVFLIDGFEAHGVVRLVGASIGRDLDCTNGKFLNKGGSDQDRSREDDTKQSGSALNAGGIIVKGSVYMCGDFRAHGAVSLIGASVGGSFDCEGGRFFNKGGDALRVDSLTMDGGLFLRNNFKAHGEVRLVMASIGGDLTCDQGSFINKGGDALSADRASVQGSMFFRDGFLANGEVRLRGVSIGRDLHGRRGHFSNAGGIAISADDITVKGSVLFREHFKANGEVRLLGASVEGQIACMKAEFSRLDLQDLRTPDVLSLGPELVVRESIDLRNAQVGRLAGDENTWWCMPRRQVRRIGLRGLWPKLRQQIRKSELKVLWYKIRGTMRRRGLRGLLYKLRQQLGRTGRQWRRHNVRRKIGKLELNGFEYGSFGSNSPADVAFRLKWIQLQEFKSYSPQPYQQLAKVYRAMGDDRAAKNVNYAREKAYQRHGNLRWPQKLWHGLFGLTLAYGYYVHYRVPFYLLFFLVLGAILFWMGSIPGKCLMWPTDSGAIDGSVSDLVARGEVKIEYPAFSPFMYSLDALVPMVDFHQQKYWLPNANAKPPWGWRLRAYLWIHIAAGWFFSTMFVLGITGVARR